MPTDDDPDVLARRRAHLEILAERLHKTVEQLQANGIWDERRKLKRRTSGSAPLVVERERRTGQGRRQDDNEQDCPTV